MSTLLSLPKADLDAVRRLAEDLSRQLRPGDLVLLIGDLGSGKTTFARFLIQALGVAEDVPSPTFTLVQTYEGHRDGEAIPLWHFDLYRLEEPEEVYELGLEEALDDGVALIEWPEIAAALLPANRLELRFSAADDPGERRIVIEASREWATRWHPEAA